MTRRSPSPTLRGVSPSERAIMIVSVGALGVYAVVALTVGHWWLSGVAAPVAGVLLARRHRRARFSTYVVWSVVVMRSVATRQWPMALAGALAIVVLQTPAAVRLWPRLQPGGRPGDMTTRVD